MSLEDESEDRRNSRALKALFNHPEVGLEAKRLYKKAVPDAKFPDVEMDDRIKERTAPLQDEIKRLQEQATERDIANRRAENHAKVRDAGLEPDAIEKIMTDEKIHSYDTAIKYATAQNRLAPATPQSVTPIRMPENAKEISKNPAQWARNEAFNAINELRGRKAL